MISDPEDRILQVTAVTGCNDYQANVVLKRCGWDVTQAVNSFFDDPPPERLTGNAPYSASTAVVPFVEETDSAQGWDQPATYNTPIGPPPSANAGDNAIDLTNDADDDDFRKAMEQSLIDSHQQVSNNNNTATVAGSDVHMSEDEHLRQALEASVQSHHDLLQGTTSGARTPMLPQHLDLDQHQRRQPEAPVALIAPYSSLDVIASLLQALYAAAPARKAFLQSRPVDKRVSDLTNYWKGASPSVATEEEPRTRGQTRTQACFDLTQRIQTLFAFMTETQRSMCVVSDVSALAPTEAVARGADSSPAAAIQVANLFFHFLVDKFDTHVASIEQNLQAQEESVDWLDDRLFKTAGSAALTTPPPETQDSCPAPNTQTKRHHISLRHDTIDADIISCLRAALARDGEGALLTRPAKVLNMAIESVSDTPFRLDPTIYLDSLMWERRRGVRLEAEQHDAELIRLSYIRQQLSARKRKLTGDSSRLSIDLLQHAKRYFDEVAVVSETDAVRSSMHKEAAPRLTNLIETLKEDLATTDELLARIDTKMNTKRAGIQAKAQEEASNPEWNQYGYDLCAVLCQDAMGVSSYVKQSNGSWWKVMNGRTLPISFADISQTGIFWVIYTESAPTSPIELPEVTQASISEDNLTFESELLSLLPMD